MRVPPAGYTHRAAPDCIVSQSFCCKRHNVNTRMHTHTHTNAWKGYDKKKKVKGKKHTLSCQLAVGADYKGPADVVAESRPQKHIQTPRLSPPVRPPTSDPPLFLRGPAGEPTLSSLPPTPKPLSLVSRRAKKPAETQDPQLLCQR